MKSLLFLAAVVATFLTASAAFAQQTPSGFQVGEKITYNVGFANFTDAGVVELMVVGREKVAERDALRLQARVRTTGVVAASIFPLENEYNSLVSPETGLPFRIQQTLRESNAPTDVRRDFSENLTTNPNNVFDFISAIYRVRSLNVTNGAQIPIKVWQNEQIYEAELRHAGRKTISTAVGAFSANVVQVRVLNNDKYNQMRLQIYVSDDERRLPVAFTLKHRNGDIRADIASVEIVQTEPVVVPIEPVPTPIPTPRLPPTPRPTPAPKPYVPNEPLAADLPFALGEKLNFEISRNAQKIGSLAMEIKERNQFNGRDAVQLSAVVTESAEPNFISSGSGVSSFIHPEYLSPFRTDIRAGGNLGKFTRTLSFDQERGNVSDDKAASTEIPVGTHDLLSLAYAIRTFRFDFGDKTATRDIKVAVFLKGTPTIITIRRLGGEPVEFAGKSVKTMSLALSTGDPRIDAFNLRLWLSEDARRLPLRFAFTTPLGEIRARLISQK
jgi:hypothetical protein